MTPLSQLICAGCALSEPTRNMYFDRASEDALMLACALGAAYLGGRHDPIEDYHNGHYLLVDEKAITSAIEGDCGYDPWKRTPPHSLMAETPWPDYGAFSIGSVVTLLNDESKWSREKIADLLERHGL